MYKKCWAKLAQHSYFKIDSWRNGWKQDLLATPRSITPAQRVGVKRSGERPFQVTTLKLGRGENQNFHFLS